MRFFALLAGDIRFQFKYGFYFLYVLLTVFYCLLLIYVPLVHRQRVAALLIFTDPSALGLFFMGAIILLERSQRVLPSLAVSPVRVGEYLLSKLLSLAVVGTLAGSVVGLAAALPNGLSAALGVLWGSVLFSSLGLILGSKAKSLNGFLLASALPMMLIIGPVLGEVFGLSHALFILNPGNALMALISGKGGSFLSFGLLALWTAAAGYGAWISVRKMFRELGGAKL